MQYDKYTKLTPGNAHSPLSLRWTTMACKIGRPPSPLTTSPDMLRFHLFQTQAESDIQQ